MNEKDLVCERCGSETNMLYSHTELDDEDRPTRYMICWSCDHDVINGDDFFVEPADIIIERQINNYEYDPINSPKPEGYL